MLYKTLICHIYKYNPIIKCEYILKKINCALLKIKFYRQ